MSKFILIILLILSTKAYATKQVLQWPSEDHISVCQPNDTNTGCGSSTGGTGTVTNIQTATPLIGGPITTTGTISCNVASGSQPGCLSSADWTTFNNKSTISGLTTNKVTKATSSTTIGDSGIFDNGNVGIGTVVPGDLFTVGNDRFKVSVLGNVTYNQLLNGSAATNAIIQNTNTASGSQTVIIGSSGDSSNLVLRASANVAQVDTNIKFNVGNSGTEAARFNLSGNLGIGSTAPGTILDVIGTTRTTGFQLPTGASTSYVLQGNSVGVGTWVPSTTLAVTATASPAGGLNAIQYNSPIGTQAGKEQTFSFNGTNVGIGTSNGRQLLDVRGNTGIGTIYAGNNAVLEVTGNGTDNPFRVNHISGPDPTPLIVNSNGNVGIGTSTSSTYKLNVIGGVNSTAGYSLINTSSANFFTADTLGTYIGTATRNTSALLSIHGADTSSGGPGKPSLEIIGRAITMPASSGTVATVYFGQDNITSSGGTGTATNTTVYINDAPAGNLAMRNTAALFVNSGDTQIYQGNLGIGTFTNPKSRLIVFDGNVGIGTFAAEGGRLIIPVGNVGIGTLRPGTMLDIQGTARTTGLQLNLNPSAGYILTSNTVGVGTWMPASTLPITKPEQTISYQPGLLTAINSTIGVYGKFVNNSTVDNIVGSAVTFSCIANPTVTMYECGTSTTCSGPTTIGTVTVTTAGTAVDGIVSNAAITAGDYVGFAMTAGTCASIDISVTAQVHSN